MDVFVDVSYLGLDLGRRSKLTAVAASEAYLELANPMPVGTELDITAEGGVRFGVVVRAIHEQVAGAERPPGMAIEPVLPAEAEAARAWWGQHAAAAASQPRRTRELTSTEAKEAREIAERIVRQTGQPPLDEPGRPTRAMPAQEVAAVVEAAASADVTEAVVSLPAAPDVAPAPAPAPAQALAESAVDDRPTTAMDVVDPALLPGLDAGSDGLVDDGRRTVAMDAVDPALLAELTRDHKVSEDGKVTSAIPVIPDDGDKPAAGAKSRARGKKRGRGR